MDLVIVKNKFQVVIPQRVRKQAGVEVGDLLEVRVQRGKITLTPKAIVDKLIAEGLGDLRRGRTHGPYASAKEAISALEDRTRVRPRKRR